MWKFAAGAVSAMLFVAVVDSVAQRPGGYVGRRPPVVPQVPAAPVAAGQAAGAAPAAAPPVTVAIFDLGKPLGVFPMPGVPRAGDSVTVANVAYTVTGVQWLAGDDAVALTVERLRGGRINSKLAPPRVEPGGLPLGR